MIKIEWIGIAICLAHSALFSGLNLGFFGVSRLRLVIQAEANNKDAARILNLRKDAHLLLSTLLWGNVASNVLLALFAESILSGVGAFLFSTIGITFLGEIFPQAYLVKHTLKSSRVLVPIVRLYQFMFYPIAKPTALLLDFMLGKEQISYFQEHEVEIFLKKHAFSNTTDLELQESIGAINFLKMDDIKIKAEGEKLNPKSIVKVNVDKKGHPIFPDFQKNPHDLFLNKINESNEKWVVFVNPQQKPIYILNADQFLRDVFFKKQPLHVLSYCHKPIVITNPNMKLIKAILKFKVPAKKSRDDVIDKDVILLWTDRKKILTGADILGRLLRGIIEKE